MPPMCSRVAWSQFVLNFLLEDADRRLVMGASQEGSPCARTYPHTGSYACTIYGCTQRNTCTSLYIQSAAPAVTPLKWKTKQTSGALITDLMTVNTRRRGGAHRKEETKPSECRSALTPRSDVVLSPPAQVIVTRGRATAWRKARDMRGACLAPPSSRLLPSQPALISTFKKKVLFKTAGKIGAMQVPRP